MLSLDRAKNKSFQVEATYQRDGNHLNHARERLDSAARNVTHLKEQFWAEMRRVSREIRTPTDAVHSRRQSEYQRALLNPLKRLKKELSAAELARYDAKSQVDTAVSAVVKSAKQRESFSGLVATLKAKAQRQKEGHRQEEVTEGAAFRLGMLGKDRVGSAARGNEIGEIRKPLGVPNGKQGRGQFSRTDGLGKRLQEDSTGGPSARIVAKGVVPSTEPRAPQERVLIHAHLLTIQPASHASVPQQVISAVGPRHSVTEVVHFVEAGEHTLSLSVQLTDGRSVGLQITAGKDTPARVSIDPRGGGLMSLLLRERGALLSRLQAAGVRVQEIGVGPSRPSTDHASVNQATLGRNARRRRIDDDAEYES